MALKYFFNDLFTAVKRSLHSCEEMSSRLSRDVFTSVKRLFEPYFQGRRIIYFTLFVVILFYVYCCNLVV